MFDVPRRAIVVLGQSLNRDGTIPATLESRARTAAYHWLEHQDAVLVLTGGDPAKCGVSEALRMQQLVEIRLGRPVPPALLLLEEARCQSVANGCQLLTAADLNELLRRQQKPRRWRGSTADRRRQH